MFEQYVDKMPKHLQGYMSKPTHYERVGDARNSPNASTSSKLFHIFLVLVKTFLTCALYYVDLASDLYLLVKYYQNEQKLYFGLTLGIMVFSIICVKVGLFISGCVFSCQLMCSRQNAPSTSERLRNATKSCCFIMLFSVLCFTQLHMLVM